MQVRYDPTFDKNYCCEHYTHRPLSLVRTVGRAKDGTLGLDGANTSGNHMVLSCRLLCSMPYCYFGPGRVADARFFLLVQNDERFNTAYSSSLCISHTKRENEIDHILEDELNRHIRDEYSFIGYNYVLFYLLYHNHDALLDMTCFKSKLFADNFFRKVTHSVLEKMPLTLAEQLENIEQYKRILRELQDYASLSEVCFNTVIVSLEKTLYVLEKAHNERNDLISIRGLEQFRDGINIFNTWGNVELNNKIDCTYL